MSEPIGAHNLSLTLPPIGVFDSGLGGLSVWREVVKLLPNHSIIYVSDNAYCPYGPRPVEVLIKRTQEISRFLIEQGCALIVVACNTATAAAIDHLRSAFPLPFVGMEPAVKPAALHSKTGVVGILATRGTFQGRLYQETSHRFAAHIRVIEQIGDGLVELVEQGLAHSPEALQLLHTYIDPMIEAGADHLVLGCTHYPFLIPVIEQISQGRMTIIDPAPAVAQQVCAVWEQRDKVDYLVDTPPIYRFYTTGSEDALRACYDSLAPPLSAAVFFPFFRFS